MSNSKKYHVSLNDILKWDSAATKINELEVKVNQLWDQVFSGTPPTPPVTDKFFTGLKINNTLLGDPAGVNPISSMVVATTNGNVVIGGPFKTVNVNGTLIHAG